MTSVSAWHHAVEHIDSTSNSFNNIRGSSYAHEITRLIYRHKWLNNVNYTVHFLSRLTYSQSADSIAVKVKLSDILHVLYAEVVIGGTLIDTEKHLFFINSIRQAVETVHFLLAAVQPAGSTFNRTLSIVMSRWIFNAFIKSHSNS